MDGKGLMEGLFYLWKISLSLAYLDYIKCSPPEKAMVVAITYGI
jgi:hypothetical protein